jgi:hypothetical protein
MKTINNSNRTIFLDNIRSLIIILVLILHSGASYGTGVDFWPFHDNNPNKMAEGQTANNETWVFALSFPNHKVWVIPLRFIFTIPQPHLGGAKRYM